MEGAFRRLDRQILLDSLQVGAPATETRAALQAEGLPSCPAVEALYEWRNGSSTAVVTAADDIHILPGFYMYSLENAVATHAALKTDSRWRVGRLPLFTNEGGDFDIIDLSRPNEAPIRHFRIEESERRSTFATRR